MFISKSVHQSMEENCQDISTSERIACIIDRVQEKLKSEDNFCLPFQYNQFFPELLSSIPQCTQEMASAYDITFVSKSILSNVEYHNTLETAYKVAICHRQNLPYKQIYFINDQTYFKISYWGFEILTL